MQPQKLIIFFSLLLSLFVPPVFSFWVQFVVDVPAVSVTLGSLESSSTDFTISRSPAFANFAGESPYKISAFPVCNQYDDFGECADAVPDLCPYLALQPNTGETTEIGFTQNPSPSPATGLLNHPVDDTDAWNVSVTSPCFEGECPADYDSFQNGAPLPQSQKGQTFKCNLVVDSTDFPDLVKNYLKQNVAYADNPANIVEISAVLTGEVAEIVPTHNPVIIVPGLLGTEIIKTTDNGPEKLWLDFVHNLTDIGDQFMDALQFNADLTPSDTSLTIGDVIGKKTFARITFDYSYGLMAEFENQGYVEGTDLFLLPYDWRYGVNEDNVNKLKQKITDVLNDTNADKVDVIAHSTGGLLVKKYVVENPSDNHIDKAVFVGVPNTGAPKAIKALIQGDSFGVPLLAEEEMKKVAKNLPVAYDLSPSEEYFNDKGSYVKIIDQHAFRNIPRSLSFEEANSFLINDHELNNQALTNARNLHTADFDNYDMRTAGIDLYAVNGCRAGTIGKFVEARFHGIFGSEEYSISNFKIEETSGDGTVPFESATNLPIDQGRKYYALEASHAKMMSQDGIRQQIVNIISGSSLSTQNGSSNDLVTQNISRCELNGKLISVFSPLSIDIVDQDGNHAGLASDGVSIENNIPNADFQIIDDHKFVYLPIDEGQTYTISVAGTGTGTFTITDASISANNVTQTQVFSNISVTPSLLGHINLNTTTTLTLDTNGDGITDQTLTPTSVLDATQSQDFIPEQPSSNPAPVSAGGAGLVSPSPVIPENKVAIEKVENKPVTQPVVSVPVITPVNIPEVIAQAPVIEKVTKKETNSVATVSTKNIKNTKIISTPVILENPPKESLPEANTLTANVADAKIPTSSKIILGGFLGLLLAFLFL